jgi:hypothetical protein
MNLEGAFCNVSGVDPNDGAKIVFVWRRGKSPGDHELLGSGHVVGAMGRPPGIQIGQYSITFPLPPGCSPDDLVVTDDTSGKEQLPGVTVTPCSPMPGLSSGGTISPGDPTDRPITNKSSPKSSHLVMAAKRSSRHVN